MATLGLQVAAGIDYKAGVETFPDYENVLKLDGGVGCKTLFIY